MTISYHSPRLSPTTARSVSGSDESCDIAMLSAVDEIVRMSDRVSRTRFWKRRAKKVDVCHCVFEREVDAVNVCRTRATASRTVAIECRIKAYIRVILA
jgi:hypothetical protein